MSDTTNDKSKRRPRGEGLLDLEGLADRWGYPDLEELKRFIRSDAVPFFSLGKRNPDKIRWDRVRFRVCDIQAWEGDNLTTCQPKAQAPAATSRAKAKSLLRCRER